MADVMNCKVYVWNPEKYDYAGKGQGWNYVYITPEELARDYCIWNDMNLWLKTSVPEDRHAEVCVWNPTPYDIWNYECFPFWEGDEQTKKIIRYAYISQRKDCCQKCVYDDKNVKPTVRIYYSEEIVKGTNVRVCDYCDDCAKWIIDSERIDIIDTIKVI
jgi:hypothetical protein